MKKKWSILLTANLLSALVSPLMVHAVTPTTESEEILKNISQTSQTYASESIAQSDAIKQTLKNIQETYDTQKNTDDTSSTEETTDTTSTTLSEESTQPTEKEMTESDASNKNIQKVSARSAIQPRAARATQSGTWGSVSWEFNSSTGILNFTSGGNLGTSSQSPWGKRTIMSDDIKKIVFSKPVVAHSDSSYLFTSKTDEHINLQNVVEIEGLANIDVSRVTSMSYMFENMQSIKVLDLSSWNVSKVTDMRGMFEGTASIYPKDSKDLFLDISSFNISSSSPDITDWFRSSGFNKIKVGPKFNVKSRAEDNNNVVFPWAANWYDEDGTSHGGSFPPPFSKAPFLTYLAQGNPGIYSTYKPDPAPEVLKWGEVPYTFDESTGKLTFTDSGTLGDYTVSPWNRTDGKAISSTAIKTIEFTKSVKTPANSSYLFSDKNSNKLSQLTNFSGVNNIDTTNATDMSYMFAGVSNLKSLDVSSFKTLNTTNMSHMFQGMSNLTSLNVSSFDTSKVKNMSYMFQGMTGITTLNVSNFNTTSVTLMNNMFAGMTSLTSIDVTKFNTSKVTNMSSMFANTKKISSLNLGNFDFTKVTNKGSMFLNDTLKEITLPSTFSDTENTTKLNDVPTDDTYNGNWVNINNKSKKLGQTKDFLVNEAGKAGTYVWGETVEDVLKWGEVPYTFDAQTGKLTFVDGGTLGDYTVSPWNRTDGKAISASAVKTIEFTKSVKTPANSSYLFSDKGSNKLTQLSSFSGVNNINTSSATDMSYMFAGMSGITNLDLSGFNTAAVTTMYGMFTNMTKLNKLTIASFDTSKVTNTAFMFSNCNALEEIQLPKFSNVTYAVSMFANMSALTKLDLSGFDFSKIAEGKKNSMFSNDTLKEITLPSTFSDPSNNTKLNQVPKENGYNGQWQNSNGKLVGETNTFLQNYNGQTDAGTYTWGKYLTWGDVPYIFDEQTGKLTFVDGGTLADYTKSPWNRTDGKAISASAVKIIEFTKPVKTPANSSYLFSDSGANKLTQLTGFTGFDNVDTTNATNMANMFYGQSSVTQLDLSHFVTKNVVNMSNMFYGLSSLELLNVSSFDTSSVTDMTAMFEGLRALKELDISSFDTKKVTSMKQMFNNDSLITKLVIDNKKFDTSNVTTMFYMFNNMSSVTSLDVSGFNTEKVTTMQAMFRNNKAISSLNLASFNFSNVATKTSMFENDILKEITLPNTFSDPSNSTKLNQVPKEDGYNGQWQNSTGKLVGQTDKFLQNYNGITDAGTYTWGKYLTWGDVPYEFDATTGTLTFIDSGTFSSWEYSPWNRADGKAIQSSDIKKIVLTKNVKTSANAAYLFSDGSLTKTLTNTTQIEGLNKLDTSNATNMQGMFSMAGSLVSIDLSNFNTSNVTKMNSMFYKVTSVTQLDVSTFDTKNVTNMTAMFEGSTSLTTLDLTNFETENVTTMRQMFNNLHNLTTLKFDKTKFNTSNVNDMSFMFNANESLSEIDVTGFNTSNVTNMQYMFSNMKSISSLNLGNFEFISTVKTAGMFASDILREITLPNTFSDPNNTTKLNDVPTTDGYNGNWVNIENKNVNLGQTSDFLKNTAGKAGTYIWGRQSALHLVKVPDLYDFGSKNAVKDITQIIKPTTSDIKNVEIRDDREQKSSWSLSVQASQLESDKLDNLGQARYQFDITSTTDANLPINGIDYVNKKVVLPTDNSSQILYSVTDDNQSPTSYNTWINDMKLIVPENTGKPNEQYQGTITWSLDLTPKD